MSDLVLRVLYRFDRLVKINDGFTFQARIGEIISITGHLAVASHDADFYLIVGGRLVGDLTENEIDLNRGRFHNFSFNIPEENVILCFDFIFNKSLDWLSHSAKGKWGIIPNSDGEGFKTKLAFADYRDAVNFKLWCV